MCMSLEKLTNLMAEINRSLNASVTMNYISGILIFIIGVRPSEEKIRRGTHDEDPHIYDNRLNEAAYAERI